MSEEVKKAVIVGKIELKPRREIVVGKKQEGKPQFQAKQDRPKRQDRPQDPRTVNTQTLAELQYLKAQIKKLQEANAELGGKLSFAHAFLDTVDNSEGAVSITATSPEKLAETFEALKALRTVLGRK